jgi:hypothetical protein
MVELTLPDGKKVKGKQIPFSPRKEEWNEYVLDDGNILQIKLVVTDVFRTNKIEKATGQPIYLAKSQNAVRVIEAEKP